MNMWKTSFILLLLIICTINGKRTKKRVCIIGAGISGLVAAKYFGEYRDEFEPVVFEKSSDVGGLWVYTDSTTVDEHGLPVHSSIYKSLRTNAIKEVMTFPDYPQFGGEAVSGSYVKHQDVLQYLRNYTDHFNLRDYIQFDSNVEKVKPLPNLRWSILTKNLNTKIRSETSCDIVIVCKGNDVEGYIPKIPGVESFSGQVLHSHVYRKPEPFANQTVVVLGASFSGIDISADIGLLAKKVYLSHRHEKLPDVFPSNLEQVPGVVSAEGNQLILSNGTKIQADALVYCTGYTYNFPFLDDSSGITVEGGKYIRHIYKHFINIERPTMAFINLPEPGAHFMVPLFQLHYYRAVLRGQLSLPSREKMLIESQLPARVSKKNAHRFSTDDLSSYMNELATASGGEPLPWWDANLSKLWDEIFDKDPLHFRDWRVLLNENNRTVEFVKT